MSRRKWGPRAFFSCLLVVLALTMLTTASANAEGNWRIEGKNISESTTITGQGEGVYAFLVPSRNVELVFQSFAMDEGFLLPNGTSYKVFLFTEGKVYTLSPALEEISSCKVGNLTFKVKGELVLHNGITYELLSPAEGTLLTTTTYSSGTGCPLPKTVPIPGSLVLEDPGGLQSEAVSHLVEQTPGGLFPGHGMLFGTHPMELDGSFSLELTGEHKGQKWSGVG